MNNKVFQSLITIIETSGVSMEELYKYYQETNTVVKEEKKTPVKKTAKKPVSPAKKAEGNSPVKMEEKKKSWGDYSDDEDELPKFNVSFSKVVKKGTQYENEEETPFQEIQVIEEEIEEEEEEEEEFKTFVKKSNKKSKEFKNPKNLLAISTGAEFQQMCNERKRPGIDYVIAPDGHCEHTHEGTLCKNIRREPICYKIHMQRCTDGEYCQRGDKCTFIHVWDMNDEEAKENFRYTIREYNKIKPDKKVRN